MKFEHLNLSKVLSRNLKLKILMFLKIKWESGNILSTEKEYSMISIEFLAQNRSLFL